MKKVVAFFMVLVLCVGLAVPVLADEPGPMMLTADGVGLGKGTALLWPSAPQSGNGWSWSGSKLTLNGFTGNFFAGAPTQDMVIELANGSKNFLHRMSFYGDRREGLNYESHSITFEGGGQLELSPDGALDKPLSYGRGITLALRDGLVLTGGEEAGDSYPLTLLSGGEECFDDTGSGMIYDGYPAYEQENSYDQSLYFRQACYVRIAPGPGAEVSEPPAVSAASAGFTDVPADSPFRAAIDWAVEQDITKGKTASSFGPGDTCTISHILTFLYRAENGADNENERAAVGAWANSLNLDDGDLGFPCTRAIAVVLMWIAAGRPAPTKSAVFADVPSGANYAQAVSWAVEQGITKGTTPTTFSPDKTCTRGQIVTFLYRASK